VTTTLEILDGLIAFPSVSTASNMALIGFVSEFLAQRGIESRLIPNEAGDKASLIATIGPSVEGGVLLSGHTDVVPIEGQVWTSNPFRLTARGDRLFGRGAADMKGFLAATLNAAGRAAARTLRKPLHLAFSYDEEIGCVGVRPMLEILSRSLPKPRLCIVGEPTLMKVAIGHKGKIAAKAECLGVEGHSALAPKALNALHLATDFIQLLRRRQAEIAAAGARDDAYDIPYTTLHAGRMSGGVALNIVPAQAEILFEIRHMPGDETLIDTLRRDASAIAEGYRDVFSGAAVDITIINAYPGLETDRATEALAFMERLIDAGRPTKVAFGTEAGLFQSALGVPTVVCGPGAMEQGHRPDEFIAAVELDRCDRMLDVLLDELAG
jgi:acetylornithine deacetylase